MSIHHTDPPEDLERMNSDELLNTIRNSTMQISIHRSNDAKWVPIFFI